MSALRNFARAATASLLAGAMVFGVAATAAHAEEPSTVEQPLANVDGTVSVSVAEPTGLPLVESEIGRGAALSTAPGSLVDVSAATGAHTAALVRVAALSASEDITVFAAGGTPVLFAPKGTSASTSVLLPVAGGAVQLWASAPAQTRVEVLAAFTGEEAKPGSIFALDAPVTRADTSVQLAGSALSTAPLEIGVIGRGGVPSEGVRAVVATLDVTVPAATVLRVDAQRLPVPAGRSVLTTIVPPDADGTIHVRTESGSGSLRLDVRGWVAEAPFYAEQANLKGSFVPVTEASGAQRVSLTAQRNTPATGSVVVGELQDAEFSLGLLAATPSSETTLLNLGEAYEGRGRGLVVDGARGAAPQLAVTRSEQEAGSLTLRRGSTDVTWTPVGDIISGERSWALGEEDPTVVIESPLNGSQQDLGDHGYFTLSGSGTTPGSSVDRIEVSGPEGLIGTATLFFDEGSLDWEFDAAAPDDGSHTYTVTIYDRAGRSSSEQVEVAVTAVDEEDTVTAPNAFLFNSPGDDENQGGLVILAEAPDGGPTKVAVDARPAFSPGDTLISPAVEATPDGVLLTVLSVDRVGSRWEVETAAASLDEVFFQADIDETTVLDDPSRIVPNDDESAIEAPVGEVDEAGNPIQTDVEFSDGPGQRAWVETEDVDLEDLPETGSGGAGEADSALAWVNPSAVANEYIAPALGTSFNSSLATSVNILATWAGGSKSGPTLKEISKEIKDPDAREQALKDKYEQVKQEKKLAVALSVKGQAALQFTAVLDTSITWKWGFIPTGITINELTIKAVLTLKVSATVKINISTEVGGTWWNPLGGFRLPTVTIMAGVLPIVFTNDLEFAFKAKIGLEFSAELPEMAYKKVYTFGFTYRDGVGYKSLSEEPKTSGSFGIFDGWDGSKIGGKLSISAGPEAELSTKIYSLTGPTMTLSGMLKFGATVTAEYKDGELRPSAAYMLALVIELKVGVKIVIWKKNLGSWDTSPLIIEKPLLEGKTSSGKSASALLPVIRGPDPPSWDGLLRA